MQEVRRNEFKELLFVNELMFVEHTDFIKADIPELGEVTYYPKKNRLNIHKGNKWESGGYYFVKNHLGKSKEKIIVRCTLGDNESAIDNELYDKIKSIINQDITCYVGTPFFRNLVERKEVARFIDTNNLNDLELKKHLTAIEYYDYEIKKLLNL